MSTFEWTEEEKERARRVLETGGSRGFQCTGRGELTEAECNQMRQDTLNGMSNVEVAKHHDVAHSAVQYHIKGECDHDPETPQLRREGTVQKPEWVIDE